MSKYSLLVGGLAILSVASAAASEQAIAPGCTNDDRDVEILSRQEPYYPHSALIFCLTGEVKARFTIDQRGMPKDIRVVESKPATVFDRAAAEAIERWRFIPACRDGKLAEREAVQTIKFRLPDESRQACSGTVGQLREETAELIGEIGARYALLAEFWQTGDSWPQVQTAIEAPFGNFSGDLARVAGFHHHALGMIAEGWRGRPVERLLDDAVVALMASSLANDPGLKEAREKFERSRAAFERQIDQSRVAYQKLSTAFRQLERDTQLDDETLSLLVKPFLGDPEVPFDEVVHPGTKSFEDLERILLFLESTRGEWQVIDGRVRFEDEDNLVTSRALWEEFLEHRQAVKFQTLKSMRSFQDYSD